MANDKIEIIPMGKSPVHEAMEWLVMYELLCKQVASAFGVPPETLKPSNKGLQADGAKIPDESTEALNDIAGLIVDLHKSPRL